MKLHASGEDYLEAILVLHKKMGMVRSVDAVSYTHLDWRERLRKDNFNTIGKRVRRTILRRDTERAHHTVGTQHIGISSEMCIRDRQYRCSPCPGREARPRLSARPF